MCKNVFDAHKNSVKVVFFTSREGKSLKHEYSNQQEYEKQKKRASQQSEKVQKGTRLEILVRPRSLSSTSLI